MAATIRRRMLLTGARHALAPVLDIARDPRWGRIEETYGEDPYLAAELGCAYIAALQGDRPRRRRASPPPSTWSATALAEGGINQAPAHLGRARAARRAAVPVRGGRPARPASRSVMPAYCDVDGVPCHASAALLDRHPPRRVGLRRHRRVGLHRRRDDLHRPPADRRPGRGGAAGPRRRRRHGAAAHRRLRRAARGGARGRPGRTSADLDATVARVLRMKFRLGLFERPYVPIPGDATSSERSPRTRRAPPGRSPSARWSCVKNDGILPLAPAAGASRSSGRSPTARATCSATTATWSTWRRSARCARAPTRSASSARAR